MTNTYAIVFTTDEGVVQAVPEFRDVESDLWLNYIDWDFLRKQLRSPAGMDILEK